LGEWLGNGGVDPAATDQCHAGWVRGIPARGAN